MTEKYSSSDLFEILAQLGNLYIYDEKDDNKKRYLQITMGGEPMPITKFEIMKFRVGLEQVVDYLRDWEKEWDEFYD